MNKVPGLLLIAMSAAISIAFLVIASRRNLTGLENTLFQVLTLALGLIGSYVLGKEGARESAAELVKPHAKSAFRRLLSLYNSLSRLGYAIQDSRNRLSESDPAFYVLDKLQGIVIEQISTADDALEDWKDIIPEELEKLRATAGSRTIVENP
jgi:hypothetical protein